MKRCWSIGCTYICSAAIYYCSPDKSLHPIRFIWAWQPAGIFYPAAFLAAFYIKGPKRQRETFPTTLTPCGQLPLTWPPDLTSHMADHRGTQKTCWTKDYCWYLQNSSSQRPPSNLIGRRALAHPEESATNTQRWRQMDISYLRICPQIGSRQTVTIACFALVWNV